MTPTLPLPLPVLSLLLILALPAAPAAVQAQTAGAATLAMDGEEDPQAMPGTAADDAAAQAETVAGSGSAEEEDPLAPRNAIGLSLDDFLWVARPIVVFADTPADPRFIEQMQLLTQRPEALLERDVVILYDTDPDARSEVRQALRPRGFSIVVVTKDGSVGLRRPAPRDVRELIRAIDNFALRQEEMQQGR